MASGMDTDSIVRDLMKPQQYKIDQQKKQQTLVKLRQDAWKEMNTKLYDFHTKFTHKMSLGGSYSATIATSSNEGAISIPEGQSVPLGAHEFEITQLAKSASASVKVPAGIVTEDGKIDLKNLSNKLEMTVNGDLIPITLLEGDTLSDLAQKMNTAFREKGFQARYDKANDAFFINATKSGSKQVISFDVSAKDGLFDQLGFKTEGAVKPGQDAKYKYNGAQFESSSNSIEINGFKATLKAVTTGPAATTTGPVFISAEPDGDATYKFVKGFITEYNKLIDDINEKLSTKPGKDILPLTSEERDAMSENDIKLWEDKINKSLFYKDDQLTKFADTARRILNQVLEGEGIIEGSGINSLSSLGIVTGNWQENGKLHILGDEDADIAYSTKPNKLKAAIAEKPEAVTKLLRSLGKELYETHGETLKSSELKSALNFYNDKTMKKQVDSFEKQIAQLEERMYKMEDIQYRKFAAMEKMLSTLHNQGSWLAQQFGGM